VHLLLPGDALFEGLAIGGDALVGGAVDFDVVGGIGLEPVPELGAKGGMFRAVGKIHVSRPPQRFCCTSFYDGSASSPTPANMDAVTAT
jgi:hypothetical protein